MLSLKDLAAQAIPKDSAPVDMSHDIAAIIMWNASEIKTCKHGTTWTHRRNKANGPVMFVCGCVEQWKDNKCVKDLVTCDRVCASGCMEWMRGRCGVWCVNST